MIEKKICASFCLFCYNQEDYILEALNSALIQTFQEMEIIVSDDCSTDNSFNIIQSRIKDYKGNHKIILNRNETNLGLSPHVNKVVTELASSDIIIFAAGDDISTPERAEQTVQLFDNSPHVYQITSAKMVIDNNSNIVSSYKIIGKNKLYSIDDLIMSKSFMVGGGATAFRKSVFDFFGTLLSDCPTEDSTIRNRSLLLGNLYESDQVWYYYRIHSNNISSPSNIFNLSSERIANQYLTDIEIAKDKGIVTSRHYNQLLHKVKFYLKVQKQKEQAYLSRSFFIKRIFWVKLKWMYLFYSLRTFLIGYISFR